MRDWAAERAAGNERTTRHTPSTGSLAHRHTDTDRKTNRQTDKQTAFSCMRPSGAWGNPATGWAVLGEKIQELIRNFQTSFSDLFPLNFTTSGFTFLATFKKNFAHRGHNDSEQWKYVGFSTIWYQIAKLSRPNLVFKNFSAPEKEIFLQV